MNNYTTYFIILAGIKINLLTKDFTLKLNNVNEFTDSKLIFLKDSRSRLRVCTNISHFMNNSIILSTKISVTVLSSITNSQFVRLLYQLLKFKKTSKLGNIYSEINNIIIFSTSINNR